MARYTAIHALHASTTARLHSRRVPLHEAHKACLLV